MMNKKNEDFIPSYVKIQNYVLDKIQKGIYQSGDKIPSENELAQLFSVSRVTANMAIKELSITGVVIRIKGKGTFVSEPENLPTPSKVLSPNLHLKPYGAKVHHLEHSTIIEAYPELCQKFDLKEHALLYEIIRSVQHQGKLVALDFSYIPFDYIGALPIHSDEITKSYMHEYLRRNTNCDPRSVKIYINTPRYPFLNYSDSFSQPQDCLIFWTTDILDKDKKIVASTFTISPDEFEHEPFITFSID
ncbi:MAG: GntR family transcriptional regulator [Hungatella sp.]